jgi:hypothetical protein
VRRFASGISEQNNQDDFSASCGHDFDRIIINVKSQLCGTQVAHYRKKGSALI